MFVITNSHGASYVIEAPTAKKALKIFFRDWSPIAGDEGGFSVYPVVGKTLTDRTDQMERFLIDILRESHEQAKVGGEYIKPLLKNAVEKTCGKYDVENSDMDFEFIAETILKEAKLS
jgi:hypothetical protein